MADIRDCAALLSTPWSRPSTCAGRGTVSDSMSLCEMLLGADVTSVPWVCPPGSGSLIGLEGSVVPAQGEQSAKQWYTWYLTLTLSAQGGGAVSIANSSIHGI